MIIYCHECGEAQTMEIELLGEVRTVPIMCACKKKKVNEIEQKMKKDMIEINRSKWIQSGYRQYRFGTAFPHQQRAATALVNYSKKFDAMKRDNKGLLLYGDVGVGKTYLAASLANDLIDKGERVKMVNFVWLANWLTEEWSARRQRLSEINNCNLLVIDDLGAERGGEYMQEQVYTVVDARYQSGNPLVVTTNTPIDEIKAPKTKQKMRVYDRLLEMCHPIKVDGYSLRREALRKDYAVRNAQLGI